MVLCGSGGGGSGLWLLGLVVKGGHGIALCWTCGGSVCGAVR